MAGLVPAIPIRKVSVAYLSGMPGTRPGMTTSTVQQSYSAGFAVADAASAAAFAATSAWAFFSTTRTDQIEPS
jgi:hypothetical protein